MTGKREYGDYQTPPEFAERICRFLKTERGISPETVLEPTCGIGNFLQSSLIFGASEYHGVEINPAYCETCKERISDGRVTIHQSDFFTFDWKQIQKEKLFIVGNPPWVNNSTLSVLQSGNLPIKSNFKGLKGMEALTGASNFDICEYMILRLLNECRGTDTSLAMLCKTSVARNIYLELERQNIWFRNCEIFTFDALRVFGIHASACLLFIQLSKTETAPSACKTCSLEDGGQMQTLFFAQNGKYHAQAASGIADIDGKCCFAWRQGVKHDCAGVMELVYQDGVFRNGQKESVEIEPDMMFPLMKSSMFKRPISDTFEKYVIVTQRKIREDTTHIAEEYPLTWAYLNRNRIQFEKRKSSIYRGAPDFSMFGVGEYSYARYKVGVSGFYKEPLFSVLVSKDGKPVMTDDTSYFICFPSYSAAYTAMLYLNSRKVQDFLKSIAFLDGKRPYTKKVLDRLDFQKIQNEVSFAELMETERTLGLEPYLQESMLDAFSLLPEMAQQSFL